MLKIFLPTFLYFRGVFKTALPGKEFEADLIIGRKLGLNRMRRNHNIRADLRENLIMRRYILIIALWCVFFKTEASVVDVLQNISQRANESQSDIVLITHQGRFIQMCGELKQYQPFETRSVTKSFVSLAVGLLLQEGRIPSIDTPVYYFFPEWNQGYKKEITIRHLLNHTSGLQIEGNGAEFYRFPDAVKMALASELETIPGTHFQYNNKAVNLLAGIVDKAAKTNIHHYLKCRLFFPLGILTDTWLCDPSGNNYGMSHLTLSALDLTKVGMLIANDGCWQGRRLLSKEWISFMTQPSQPYTPFYGPLWWLGFYSLDLYWDEDLLKFYAESGIPIEYVQSLESLDGRILKFEGHVCYGNFVQQCIPQLLPYFQSPEAIRDLFCLIESKGLPIGRWEAGKLKSISARGYLGQQLIIFPEENLVAVRLSSCAGGTDENPDSFSDLESFIACLIYEMMTFDQSQCQQ